MKAPTPMAPKSCMAAPEPRCPALWISAAATDSGKGKEIQVYIEQQLLVALEDGKEVYSFDIVTGRDVRESVVQMGMPHGVARWQDHLWDRRQSPGH